MAITLEKLRSIFKEKRESDEMYQDEQEISTPGEEYWLPEEVQEVQWLKTDQEIREALTEEDLLPVNESELSWESIAESKTAFNKGFYRAWWYRYQRAKSRTGEMETAKKQPPKSGEYLLYLFLSRGEREVLIGDLSRFQKVL